MKPQKLERGQPLKTKLTSLAIAVAAFLTAQTASAATLTVSSLADSGPGSLRDTIAIAGPGDTINFSVSGIIALFGGTLIIDKDVTISGPPAGITISGNNSGRVFIVLAGIV